MKLLLVNTVATGGSIPAYMRTIVAEAQRRGYDTAVAKGRRADMPGVDNIQIGTRFDTAIHGLGTRLFDRHGLYSRHATERFIDEIERFAPDIIHLHNIHGYYLHYPTLFRRLRSMSVPVLWTLHDSWAYTGHCTFYTSRDNTCLRWQHDCGNCPLRRLYPASVLADRSRRNLIEKISTFGSMANLTLLPVSRWLEGELKKSRLAHVPRECIGIDVDLDAFRPMASKKNKRVLGVAANWNPLKGLDYFYALRHELPADVEIRLLGRIDGHIPEGINAVGSVSGTEALAREYSEATVVVNASYAESYSMVNREALACGSSLVTRSFGPATEGLTDPRLPIYSGATDCELTAHVKRALEDKNSPEATAAVMAELFASRPQLNRLFDLYETLA